MSFDDLFGKDRPGGTKDRRDHEADKSSERRGRGARDARAMGERLHSRSEPALQPTVWYGMPGYAKDGKTVRLFRADKKSMTFGFTQESNLNREEGAPHQLIESSWYFNAPDDPTEAKLSAIVREVSREGCRLRGTQRNQVRELELSMKKAVPEDSASAFIDEKIKGLGDWRGRTLAHVRQLIHDADPDIQEEWKWMGTPVWSHDGLVCTGESYKQVVKFTFFRGATLLDPQKLFNSSLQGNTRRAIDIREGEKLNEAAFKELIRSGVAANTAARARRAHPKK